MSRISLKRLRLTAVILVVSACSDGDTGNANPNPIVANIVEQQLNSSLSASFTLNNPPEDPSVQVSSGGSSSGIIETHPGDVLTGSISFTAPNRDVIGVGVRFGSSGPISVIDTPGALGQTSGNLNYAVQIPPGVCDNLAQICHDIKCYEFAVTEGGAVSRANINEIALACNNCDEPSCKELLDSCKPLCDNESGFVGCAEGQNALECGPSNFGSELCHNYPNEKCWWEVGTQRFECESCCQNVFNEPDNDCSSAQPCTYASCFRQAAIACGGDDPEF